VCWTQQQQQQLFLAGRQQERKNAMALTEDGEEEDEGREQERERGIKKEAAGWMVACLEKERERITTYTHSPAQLSGATFCS
jgi:hypothetical protein